MNAQLSITEIVELVSRDVHVGFTSPVQGPEDGAPITTSVSARVRNDATDMLPLLEETDGFALAPPTDRVGPIVDRGFAVVNWTFVGLDVGRGFNRMWPTGKLVTARGVTFLDLSTGLFQRHVDWNGINSQLGGSRGRASAPLLVKQPEAARQYGANHEFLPLQ